MGRVGVFLQTPTFGAPTNWSGPVTDVLSYSVRRQVNGAGSFAITMRATAQEVSQVRTGWHVSIQEERLGQNPDITMPLLILANGRVLDRAFHIDDAGGGIFEVQGETWLGGFVNNLLHLRQSFAGANLSTILSGLIAATGVSASHSEPLRTVGQPLTITLNDQTLLAVLIKLAELTRTNLREDWEGQTWEFTDQDNLPAVGGVQALGAGDIYLRQVERGDPSQAPREGFGPGFYGVGIIQGLPTVSYNGRDVVNLVVGIGTEYDGSELTLENATYFDAKYGVHVGLDGAGNPYWYLKDDDSITEHGEVDFHLVRSDIKNPSNNGTTRAAAKAALLAVTSNELLKRRSEIQAISVQVLNGAEIAALPGSRIHMRYKGNARLPNGLTTWLDVDQYFLIMARTDTGSASGVRQVVLDLAAPVLQYTIPALPNAVAIPTPPVQPGTFLPDDPIPFPVPPPDGNYSQGDLPALPPMPDPSSIDSLAPLSSTLQGLTYNNGAYQPCCADPTTDLAAGAVGPVATGSGPFPDAQLRRPGTPLDTTFDAGEVILILLYTDDHSDPAPTGTDITVTAIVPNTVYPGFPFTPGGLTNVGLYLIECTSGAATVNWGTANQAGAIIQEGVGSVPASAGDIQFVAGGASGSTTASTPATPPHKAVGLSGYNSDSHSIPPTITGDLFTIGPLGPFSTAGGGQRTWGGDGLSLGGSDIGMDFTDDNTFPAEFTMIFSGSIEVAP